MIAVMKAILRKGLPLHLRKWLRDSSCYREGQLSFSQEGEDLLLQGYWGYERGPGFYVDIGSHHPLRLSNTYRFYRQGWRGLCIDPMSEYAYEFARYRPGDRFLNIGISRKSEKLMLHLFEYPECNTFSAEMAAEQRGKGLTMTGTRMVDCYPLAEVLEDHQQLFTKIDFMNIDVEGLDLQVLESNNWDKYSPEFLLIETHTDTIERVKEMQVYTLLKQYNYQCVAKLRMSLLFHRT